MLSLRPLFCSIASVIAIAVPAWAGKLAIVIDDFGYRPHTENQVLALPARISVSVLPNAPYAREMATKARDSGHEVLIHLPMLPLSKQALEKDTLRPEMSSDEIARIIGEAVSKVPYATGLNNHMGSAMTSSLSGMQKVMQALSHYNLYFLDSLTIGNSQVTRAAASTGVQVMTRNVFLDDKQSETEIRYQFHRAIELARRNGQAIAIGHPHPSTVRVLRQMVYNLPPDITLVHPGSLLNTPLIADSTPDPGRQHSKTTIPPHDAFHGVDLCRPVQPPPPVYASLFFHVLVESIRQSALLQYFQHQWRGARR